MTPTNEDFRMFQGNTKKVIFETTGIASIAEINNIDWYVVFSNNQDKVVLEKNYPEDISIEVDSADSSIHLISFIIDELDTANLEPRKYIHELKLKDTDTGTDYTSTISRGDFRLIKSINP